MTQSFEIVLILTIVGTGLGLDHRLREIKAVLENIQQALQDRR